MLFLPAVIIVWWFNIEPLVNSAFKIIADVKAGIDLSDTKFIDLFDRILKMTILACLTKRTISSLKDEIDSLSTTGALRLRCHFM